MSASTLIKNKFAHFEKAIEAGESGAEIAAKQMAMIQRSATDGKNGENIETLAVNSNAKDLKYLECLLDHGGSQLHKKISSA